MLVMSNCKITSPDDPQLTQLCQQLAELGEGLDKSGEWPREQLELCGQYGVFEWFLDPMWGGQAWTDEQVVRGYLALSAACLTTTFAITQRTGACRRLAGCGNDSLKQRLLPDLASGESFATVGVSHLTTSRRHLAKPVLTAEKIEGGYRLDGFSPWVTGAAAAETIVLGATMIRSGIRNGIHNSEPTGEQILIALPTKERGVTVEPPAELVGVSASQTGAVRMDQVELPDEQLMAGPVENVMASGLGAATGGHETSTLAIGLATAATSFLMSESQKRPDLLPPAESLRDECQQLENDLLAIVRGSSNCTKEALRERANSLALRATQAALAAAKGTGYVIGHPAGRWCREALFFLVWSCPQPVAAANMCEFAGLER